MANTVEQIKEKLSIVDVVAPYVKIARAGKYWKGLSPFNKEKTPSFYVNPERGSYYCFSSSQGGDMFTFIEKMEGVDFKGALKILAEKAGVEIVYEGKEDHSKRDRILEAVARAEQLFARALDPNGVAYQYALSRGLTPQTIQAWNLGFAPDAWRTILEELAAAGYTVEEALAAGLVKEADGKPGTHYDRFRNRLMFPIRDAAGRTVAFTGRALDPNDQAKYLNSPETELYKKSHILFGMDRAKDAIRTRGFALLVEGQMDLLHAHQAGFENAIALSGTALTDAHLTLIKRYSENLMLALDGDRAGLAASAKHAVTALASGMHVKAVRLPKGQDPADVISRDAKDFAKRVAEATPVVEFFLAVLAEGEKDEHRQILAAEKIVMPLIAAIQSPLEREHFVNVTARSLGLTADAVRASVPRVAREAAAHGVRPSGEQAAERLSVRAQRDLTLRALHHNYPGTALAKRIETEYARIIGVPLTLDAATSPAGDGIPERVLFETGLAFGESPAENAADEFIAHFERSVLTEALAEATTKLRQAESMKDAQGIDEASRRCDELRRRLAAL